MIFLSKDALDDKQMEMGNPVSVCFFEETLVYILVIIFCMFRSTLMCLAFMRANVYDMIKQHNWL